MIDNHHQLTQFSPREIFEIVGAMEDMPSDKRNPILAGLFHFINKFKLASRLILQSFKPQIWYLLKITYFADSEERASTILTIATEEIMSWKPSQDEFCHFNLYRVIRQRTLEVANKWNVWECETPFEILPEIFTYNEPEHDQLQLDYLTKWIEQVANVDQEIASVIVLTRGGIATISQLAENMAIRPESLRQRRMRAEQKLKRYILHKNNNNNNQNKQ